MAPSNSRIARKKREEREARKRGIIRPDILEHFKNSAFEAFKTQYESELDLGLLNFFKNTESVVKNDIFRHFKPNPPQGSCHYYMLIDENDKNSPFFEVLITNYKENTNGSIEITIGYIFDDDDNCMHPKNNSVLVISKEGFIIRDVVFNKDKYDMWSDGMRMSGFIPTI